MIDTPFEPDLYLLQVYLEQMSTIGETKCKSCSPILLLQAVYRVEDQWFTMGLFFPI